MEPAEFWSLGDYGVVGDLWSAAGRDVVTELAPVGRDVVDLATGTGVAALAAARQGARSVTGVDAAPGLLREARRRAAAEGAQVDWIEADMHRVPLPDDCADVVVSTFGLVFSPEPPAALAEARRLARPGGRVVFSSWSPKGVFGRLRQVLAPYFPQTPAPWHEDPEQIRALVGPEGTVRERWFSVEVESPERFVELMERHSAPIILGARNLGSRWSQAREELLGMVRASAEHDGAGTTLRGGYLVTTVPVA